LHRQREQLVKVRKVLEAQGRSLMVNYGIEPVQQWWKRRAFAALRVPQWIKEFLGNSQPVVLALQEKIDQLRLQLQNAATQEAPRGVGKMTSVIIDREIGNWLRFNNRRQIASYTGLCPGEYPGGISLANGALPAQLPSSTQMESAFGQRPAEHRRSAQKSHRRSGPPIGSGSVACAYRPGHLGTIGIRNLKNTEQKDRERRFEGNSSFLNLERARRSRGPNLSRSSSPNRGWTSH
jgi:hypothetical protein